MMTSSVAPYVELKMMSCSTGGRVDVGPSTSLGRASAYTAITMIVNVAHGRPRGVHDTRGRTPHLPVSHEYSWLPLQLLTGPEKVSMLNFSGDFLSLS